MKPHSAAAVLGVCTLLGACAQVQWTKAGASPDAVARDLDECREVAMRQSPPACLAPALTQGVNPAFGPMPGSPAASESSTRFVEEQQDVRQCMVKRGYTLQREN
jgi:hypothetical protein